MTIRLILTIAIVVCWSNVSLLGQGINVSGPFVSSGSSFHENFGVNFGFSFGGGGQGAGSRVMGLTPGGRLTPNVTFSQNNSVVPSFGGFDPNSGARFGFSTINGNGGGFSLGLNLSQGSSRTLTSVAPNITIPNGGFGTFTSGAFRPFVTGFIPVVGTDNAVTRAVSSGQLKPYDPNRRKSESDKPSGGYIPRAVSSATTGEQSVAEIKASRKNAELSRLENYEKAIKAAREAEQKKDYANIRRNIRTALKLTSDPEQIRELRLWMKEYRGKH